MRYLRPIIRNVDWFPSSLLDIIVDGNGKFFHTDDEKVRRGRISLSEAMGRLKRMHLVPIPKNRESGRGDTMHDKLNCNIWKAKILKA